PAMITTAKIAKIRLNCFIFLSAFLRQHLCYRFVAHNAMFVRTKVSPCGICCSIQSQYIRHTEITLLPH
ncbi:MAG: hypothetical protein K2K70_09725, partial [Lachnospiraceae bacterium]|nr:hypothetical protein [Lachnospiraceae bacterium]